MKKTVICCSLILAGCLSFAACNKASSDIGTMAVPETQSETQTAAYASGSTPEEVTEAKALIEKSEEVTVDSKSEVAAEDSKIIKELLDRGDSDASISYQGTDTLTIDSDNPAKKVEITVTTDAGINFTGNLGVVYVNSCKGFMKFSGTADTLVLNNEGASCEITGNISNLIISGKNAIVKFSGTTVTTSVLSVNTTAVIINSTDSEMAVCLSNGVCVAVPAHSTLNVADLTIAAHK